MFSNCRSVRNKLPYLELILSSNMYDIVCLVETFLTNVDTDALLLFGNTNYKIYRNDRKSHSGGVAIICKSNLNPIQLYFNNFNNIEHITLVLHYTKNIRLSCIYRPPSTDFNTHKSICKFLFALCDTISPTIIVGDFNLPLYNWNDNTFPNYPSTYCEFENSLCQNSLIQLITFPTRNNNLLDLLLTNNPMIISKINECPPFGFGKYISDHISFSFSLPFQAHLKINQKVGLNFRKSNLYSIHQSLSSIDWNLLLSNSTDINNMFNIFYNTLYNIINDNVPAYKHIKNKKTYPKYILRLKVKCLKYYKTRLDSHNNFINWKNIKKLLDYNIKKLTIDREKLILSSNDKSRFYNYINSRCSSFSTICPIKSDDNTYIFSDTVKSNILNNQFSSVFINDNDNIPHLSPPKHNSTINNFLFYRHNIRKHLINLSLSCKLPPDNIPSIFFKQFSYELSIPLTILFNKTLSAGVCPDMWKVSYIVPIFKKGDPSNRENYRPISITSIMSRVFERILVEEINFYLERNSLITDSQFGFRHKKSVEQQLLNCYTKWITAIDKGSFIDIIYLDYAKAFDKVSHSKLLVKLTNLVYVVTYILG